MRIPIMAAAALTLAACGSESPAPVETPPPEPVDPAAHTDVPDGPVAGAAIPAALQGRWGLTSADCEPGRSDAKGLLTISEDKLEFYESVGTLGAVSDAGSGRVRAHFAFTGEGITWQRDVSLELEDGGETLVRREFGADAAPEPFRYLKCP